MAESIKDSEWWAIVLEAFGLVFVRREQDKHPSWTGVQEFYRPLVASPTGTGKIGIGPMMMDCEEVVMVNSERIVAMSKLKNPQLISVLERAIVEAYSPLVIPQNGVNPKSGLHIVE